jgi:ribonucleoside-diphosphate reductase alpha chain
MGFADLLYQLGIPYDSDEGVALGERIMAFVNDEARKASHVLATERGPFPAFSESIFAGKSKVPYRNATVTTIAPTGTLSIIAGCSSGIEPLFALCFSRNILDGERLLEVNPHFAAALDTTGLHSPELMEAVVSKGSIKDIEALPAACAAYL